MSATDASLGDLSFAGESSHMAELKSPLQPSRMPEIPAGYVIVPGDDPKLASRCKIHATKSGRDFFLMRTSSAAGVEKELVLVPQDILESVKGMGSVYSADPLGPPSQPSSVKRVLDNDQTTEFTFDREGSQTKRQRFDGPANSQSSPLPHLGALDRLPSPSMLGLDAVSERRPLRNSRGHPLGIRIDTSKEAASGNLDALAQAANSILQPKQDSLDMSPLSNDYADFGVPLDLSNFGYTSPFTSFPNIPTTNAPVPTTTSASNKFDYFTSASPSTASPSLSAQTALQFTHPALSHPSPASASNQHMLGLQSSLYSHNALPSPTGQYGSLGFNPYAVSAMGYPGLLHSPYAMGSMYPYLNPYSPLISVGSPTLGPQGHLNMVGPGSHNAMNLPPHLGAALAMPPNSSTMPHTSMAPGLSDFPGTMDFAIPSGAPGLPANPGHHTAIAAAAAAGASFLKATAGMTDESPVPGPANAKERKKTVAKRFAVAAKAAAAESKTGNFLVRMGLPNTMKSTAEAAEGVANGTTTENGSALAKPETSSGPAASGGGLSVSDAIAQHFQNEVAARLLSGTNILAIQQPQQQSQLAQQQQQLQLVATAIEASRNDKSKDAKPPGKRPRSRPNHKPSVTAVLFKWLMEHQSDPYPTEEVKRALGHATGLTLNQINDWFINARRRYL
ncbi:hypothetical protein HDU76_008986 [Blyttiomyces sp. JEL0837]|nr:hypothetical protein HDU76_008986 [Blyttiomyces sp. JEL0837]